MQSVSLSRHPSPSPASPGAELSPPPRSPSPSPLLFACYNLTISTPSTTPLHPPHRTTLTVVISVDTRLPDLDVFEPRCPETLNAAYLLAGDMASHNALCKSTHLAESLGSQIRAAFGVPERWILSLSLRPPGGQMVRITALNVVKSLALDLKRYPNLPSPRRARLLGLETDELIAEFESLSPPLLSFTPPPVPTPPPPPPPVVNARILITTIYPFFGSAQMLELPLTKRCTAVAEIIDKICLWLADKGVRGASGDGAGSAGGEGGVKVTLHWGGIELPGFSSLSDNMFNRDRKRSGGGGGEGGREAWVVDLTSRLEGMGPGAGPAGERRVAATGPTSVGAGRVEGAKRKCVS